ncbi:bifunctional PIG-L family deacetylase/class I SAM-dependent methyltransferase [Microbacterium atlanticum]|uniref:bifunctional PIG-L family deacetylase/class I SAM-dependent methyltransferase n=1 Tax=Microbacterium atlanticum TaxID=2782168 RepID=UPI00188879F2|nr:bifunctional PIG-L family deacetylase/class I SAM-dependent methyltransferase [Microbacterium atlanticum]
MAGFSHLDAGTAESVWTDVLAERRLRPFDASFDALVVVAAHPDDETLGAGGLLRRASHAGARTVVVIATDGEASHPDSPTHDRATLARLRRDEVREAVCLLAPDAEVRFLGLPDGGLDRSRAELDARLTAVLESLATEGRVVVAAPWKGDRHRDHRVAAEVTGALAARGRLIHLAYPVWAWHWGTPDDLPWERLVQLALTDEERSAKRKALARHTTQIAPLSDQPGDEVLLHPGMLAHFDRDVEVFVSADARDDDDPADTPTATAPESLDAQWFDDFYGRNGPDPWGFESRWYERRKRALLMAALPAAELGDVFEIGCSTGMLTIDLAARARRVVAWDAAAAAVETARSRLAGEPKVSVQLGSVPADWPDGQFDTIVLSEVGYYLSPADLQQSIVRIDAALADGGSFVACHWRHPVEEYPQTGDQVHVALRAAAAWETLSLHLERDFVLEVFARRPARSVAEAEGLV